LIRFQKLFVLITLVALCSSAVRNLDPESLSLALLRIQSISFGIPLKETLSIGRAGLGFNYALLASQALTDSILFRAGEFGLVTAVFLFLSATSIACYFLFRRLSKSSGLAFLLTVFAGFSVWKATADLTNAIGALLVVLELALLTTGGFFRALTLVFIHPLFDTSFLLAPALIFIVRGILRTPRFKDALLLLCFAIALLSTYGIELRYNIDYSSLFSGSLISAVALILAIDTQNKTKQAYSQLALTISAIVFCFAAESVTQMPVQGLLMAYVLALNYGRTNSPFGRRIKEGMLLLESKFGRFLTLKNQVGVTWLAGAFLFFQLAALYRKPVQDTFLNGEILNKITDSGELPFHSPSVGGFIGLRLNPLLPNGAPRNAFDTGPVRIKEFGFYQKVKQALRSEKPPGKVRTVLCVGGDPLCEALSTASKWELSAKSEINPAIEKQIQALPADKRDYFEKKLQERRFFLYQKGN